MNLWNIDAGNINVPEALEWELIHETNQITDFLYSKRDHINFIIATKGYGKTLLLKAKSSIYRKELNIPFIHDNAMVDKPGDNTVIFDKEKINYYSSIQNWSNLWTLSIVIAVLKKTNEEIDLKKISKTGNELFSYSATTITDFCKVILSLGTKQFHDLIADLNIELMPKFENVRKQLVAFIDNVDEYFDIHISNSKIKSVSVDGITSRSIWYLAQEGLVNSIYQITTKNPHIKLFASIRKEVFLKLLESNPKYLQYLGNSCDLVYSHSDLKDIFIKNIFEEPNNRLVYPNELQNDPIYAFLGFKKILNSHVQIEEEIFDYIYRHTLQRPRDFMEIGREISQMNKKERTPEKIKSVINNASSKCLVNYLVDMQTHFPEIDFDKIWKHVKHNILDKRSLKTICQHYNEIDNCLSKDCKECESTHVFCTLYTLGLLGVVQKNEITKELEQIFIAPGAKSFDVQGIIPDSEYYLIHPALNQIIRSLNTNYTVSQINIIGNGHVLKNVFGADYTNYLYLSELFNDNLTNSFEEQIHIHFGAGKLGLGLVVPLFSKKNRIIIINHKSQRWEKIKSENNIKIISTYNAEIKTSFFYDDPTMGYQSLFDNWRQKNNLLICTDNEELITALIKCATSISTAVKSELPVVINRMKNIDLNKKLNVYCFENDIEVVRNWKDKITSEKENVNIITVVADRICSEIEYENGRISVTTEKHYEVIINQYSKGEMPIATGEFVKCYGELSEFDYYARKKLWLLNGIHMIIAIYSYHYLLVKDIQYHKWGDYGLNVLSEIKKIIDPIRNFIQIQSIRLILSTEDRVLEKIFSTPDKTRIFNEIVYYGETVISRVHYNQDHLGRVLKLNDIVRYENSYKERIESIHDFLKDNESNIRKLQIDGLSSYEEMLKSIIDLQKKLIDINFRVHRSEKNIRD